MKLYVKRHCPLYVPWWKRSWLWWYIAVDNWQPFKRFGHGGWICLSLTWFRRFWNGANPTGAPMKTLLCVIALMTGVVAIAQTPLPSAPGVSLAVTGQAIAYHLAGQMHAGTDATEAVAFIASPKYGAFDLEAHQITSTDSSLTAYLEGIKWTPNLNDLLAKTLLPPSAFQVSARIAPGIVRSHAGKSHVGGIIGGELNYVPTVGSHVGFTLIGADYLRAQGIASSANGYRIYGGISMSIFGTK